MKKVTKKDQIKKHLLSKKSITTWDAIEKYGCTRLAAVIHNLVHKEKMNIVTDSVSMKDRNGNSCTFAKYIYVANKL
jgi:hypothetical protein